jgi:hypothetical protein
MQKRQRFGDPVLDFFWVGMEETFDAGQEHALLRELATKHIPCLAVLERTFGSWARARDLAIPGYPRKTAPPDDE